MDILALITPENALAFAGWVLLGLAVGILSAMLGIGGGTIMIPAFRLLGGLSAVQSSATSLFTIVPTGIAGVVRHLRAGTCRVPVGLAAGIGGACTSVLGARLAHVAPGWTIMLAAAAVIGYSAVTMLVKALRPSRAATAATATASPQPAATTPAAATTATAKPAAPAAATTSAAATTAAAKPAATAPAASTESPAPAAPTSSREIIIAALIGLVAGVLSGFVGVGGGFMMVPLFCSALKMDMRHAAGTSLLAVLFIATPAAITQLVLGNVDLFAGCVVALGAVFGTGIGQRIAKRMSDRGLRLAFAALLMVAAVLLVVKELGLM